MHGELTNYSEHKKFQCEFNVTVKIYRASYRLMLNHISSQIRTIDFCAVCLTSVSLPKDIYVGKLSHQRKNEVANFKEFSLNLL